MYLLQGNVLDIVFLTPGVSANIIMGLERVLLGEFGQWHAISFPICSFVW